MRRKKHLYPKYMYFLVVSVALLKISWSQFSLHRLLLTTTPSDAGEKYAVEVSSITTPSNDNNDGAKMNAADAQPPTSTDNHEGGKVIFLNETDASTMKQHNENRINDPNRSPYTIDVLVIGSKHNIEQARVQRETWASHEAIRNFFLSTEFDDVDPKCVSEDPWPYLEHIIRCTDKNFWKQKGSLNNYTRPMKKYYAKPKWIKGKADPEGWLCAQRRFVTSFTKLIEAYATQDQLPDYLILADDDTYVNIDKIVETMIVEPKEHQAKGLDQEQSWFPTHDGPVVTAGCRIRVLDHMGTITYPFGGFGTFFSNGSLKRLIHPLNCNGTNSAVFEEGLCNKLLQKDSSTFPMNGLIGEQQYFQPGDSLNQVFQKYSTNVDDFCIHSDWFFGYIANFYNISRHTTSMKKNNYFDQLKGNVQQSRLHQLNFEGLKEDSELYNSRLSGECKNGQTRNCTAEATVCHKMNSELLRRIHLERFPI